MTYSPGLLWFASQLTIRDRRDGVIWSIQALVQADREEYNLTADPVSK